MSEKSIVNETLVSNNAECAEDVSAERTTKSESDFFISDDVHSRLSRILKKPVEDNDPDDGFEFDDGDHPDDSATEPGVGNTAVESSDESDQIFPDIEVEAPAPLIPDPDKGEISHADFEAAGYSYEELKSQRAHQAKMEAEQSQRETLQQLREAGTFAMGTALVFGGAYALLDKMARTGGGLIADSVSAYSMNKAEKQLGESAAQVNGHADALRAGIGAALAKAAPDRDQKEVVDEYLKSEEGSAHVAGLDTSLNQAFASANKVAMKGAQLELNLDEVSERSVGVLKKLKNDSSDLLDKIKMNGESLHDRFENGIKSCFQALTMMASKLASLFGFGRGPEAPAATQSSGPRMG
jgi:hypothetical protein|tara:strand:- start:820 stop:1881 length:1062 start_codon:yes stop_codon:yes gene_type:complete